MSHPPSAQAAKRTAMMDLDHSIWILGCSPEHFRSIQHRYGDVIDWHGRGEESPA